MIWFAHDIKLTRHARKRFRERTGLPIRAADSCAAKALTKGLSPDELPPVLRTKLLASFDRHAEGDKALSFGRVYGGHAYVFCPSDGPDGPFLTLVTVLPGFGETGEDANPADGAPTVGLRGAIRRADPKARKKLATGVEKPKQLQRLLKGKKGTVNHDDD